MTGVIYSLEFIWFTKVYVSGHIVSLWVIISVIHNTSAPVDFLAEIEGFLVKIQFPKQRPFLL